MDQHLLVFKEVCEQRNFTKAAKSLHMSQPAVSQYIASLEEHLGVRLLERDNKAVLLNKAGEIVYEHAKEINRLYARMETLVSEIKNKPSGELKIGASYTIGEYVLPFILVQLKIKAPFVSPHVIIGNTEDIGKKVLEHKIDLGLIEGSFSHPKIVAQSFAEDEMYVITDNKSSSKRMGDLSGSNLHDKTWLIREKGSGTRRIAETFLKNHHIMPKEIITLGSTQIIKEAVESGMGVSILSKSAIEKELKLRTLQILQVNGTPIKRTFSIIKYEQAFYPKSLIMFEEIVKKHINQ